MTKIRPDEITSILNAQIEKSEQPDEIISIIREQIEKYDQVVKADHGEKEFNHGYPYSYGDEGPDQLTYIDILRTLVVVGSILAGGSPKKAFALDVQAPAEAVKNAIESDIHPVAAAACMTAGWCLAQGNKSLKRGNVLSAMSWYCTGALIICGEKVSHYVAKAAAKL